MLCRAPLQLSLPCVADGCLKLPPGLVGVALPPVPPGDVPMEDCECSVADACCRRTLVVDNPDSKFVGRRFVRLALGSTGFLKRSPCESSNTGGDGLKLKGERGEQGAGLADVKPV